MNYSGSNSWIQKRKNAPALWLNPMPRSAAVGSLRHQRVMTDIQSGSWELCGSVIPKLIYFFWKVWKILRKNKIWEWIGESECHVWEIWIMTHVSNFQTWFWGVCSSVTPKLIKFLKSSENSEQKLCFWHVLVISNRFKQRVLEISKSVFFLLKKRHFWGVEWTWALMLVDFVSIVGTRRSKGAPL